MFATFFADDEDYIQKLNDMANGLNNFMAGALAFTAMLVGGSAVASYTSNWSLATNAGVIQIGQRNSIYTGSGQAFQLVHNMYFDGSWKYIENGAGLNFILTPSDTFLWQRAPSGTAGATASPVTLMTLNGSSGGLGLGVAPAVHTANATTFQVHGDANATEIRITNATTGSSAGNGALMRLSAGATDFDIINLETAAIKFHTGGSERMQVHSGGSVLIGTGALATNATAGFLYIPTCAGAPSGTPTSFTGRVAIVFDTTNNKLMVYDGGWIGVTVS